jgi:uncharacterized iron-regulated membrane protein
VAVAATLDQTGLVERLPAALAPTEVADQLDDLLDADDGKWCVVGVAAGWVIWSGSTGSIAWLHAAQTSRWFMRRYLPGTGRGRRFRGLEGVCVARHRRYGNAYDAR